MGLTINAPGVNAFIGTFNHNVIHQTYTNVDGITTICQSPVSPPCTSHNGFRRTGSSNYVCWYIPPLLFSWVAMLDSVNFFTEDREHPLAKDELT